MSMKKKVPLAVFLIVGLLVTSVAPLSAANGNQPPDAQFHWEPTGEDLTTDTVVQFIDDSTDPNDDIQIWEWNFGDGTQNVSAQNPTHQYDEEGTYNVTLTVTDYNWSTDSRTKQITIHGQPPVADAGPDQVVNYTLVTLNGTESYDPDGTIENYAWAFGDGDTTSGTLATVTHNYTEDGVYDATLNVTDDDGLTDEDTAQITVDTTAPTTNITLDGDEGENGWYTSNVSVTLLPTDATSGVDTTYYSINNGTWKTYTTTFVLSQQGNNRLEYYAVDDAGNIETVQATHIKIDKGAPTVNVTNPDEGYIHFFGRSLLPSLRDKTIILGRITVSAEVDGTASPVSDVIFSVDGVKQYNTSEAPYEWTWGLAFGRHTLQIQAFDEAGLNATAELDVTIFSILPGRNTSSQSHAQAADNTKT
jgi:hypothetical protein